MESQQAYGWREVLTFFPEDFNLVSAPTGKYMWKCIVKDEVIVEGQFEHSQSGTRNGATLDLNGIKFR